MVRWGLKVVPYCYEAKLHIHYHSRNNLPSCVNVTMLKWECSIMSHLFYMVHEIWNYIHSSATRLKKIFFFTKSRSLFQKIVFCMWPRSFDWQDNKKKDLFWVWTCFLEYFSSQIGFGTSPSERPLKLGLRIPWKCGPH